MSNSITPPQPPAGATRSFTSAYSVADADRQLTLWGMMRDPDNPDLPREIYDAVSADNSDVKGNAAEYHNLASEYGRQKMYFYAAGVAAKGAQQHQFDVDLLADILKFGSQSQLWTQCTNAYTRLMNIEYSKWNWRTFTFTVDYLIDSQSQAPANQPKNILGNIRNLISEYKKLNDERAWVAEAEYYLKHGKTKDAEDSLRDCADKILVAPQCCLKLTDMLLNRGEYRDVIKYASIGVRGAAQEQPSISTGYLYYVSALAKDALIHDEALKYPGENGKGFANLAAVEDALLDYSIASELLGDRRVYISNIAQRTLILHKKAKLTSPEE